MLTKQSSKKISGLLRYFAPRNDRELSQALLKKAKSKKWKQ